MGSVGSTDSGISWQTKDERHITPEWELAAELIDGVEMREVRHIVTANGITTDLFRKDWGIVEAEVVQMIHVTLNPGAISAWHMHKLKTDHLFVVAGHSRAALYDDREGSSTRGKLDVRQLADKRPTLVVVPPGVWHGIEVLSAGPASFVNFFDRAYDYAAAPNTAEPRPRRTDQSCSAAVRAAGRSSRASERRNPLQMRTCRRSWVWP